MKCKAEEYKAIKGRVCGAEEDKVTASSLRRLDGVKLGGWIGVDRRMNVMYERPGLNVAAVPIIGRKDSNRGVQGERRADNGFGGDADRVDRVSGRQGRSGQRLGLIP